MSRTKVNFSKSGMGIEEGTVLQWLKSVGDRVEQGEVIVQIETAKAVQDVEAPVSGTLVEILCEAGATPQVNSPIAYIENEHGT